MRMISLTSWKRKSLLLASVILLLASGIAFGQNALSLTNGSVFKTGETIIFSGDDIYNTGCFSLNCPNCGVGCTCDSVTFDDGVGGLYGFYPYSDYTGTNGVPDFVNFTVPPSLPCGTYMVYFTDDEDCDNGGVNVSDTVTVTILDSIEFTYPGAGIYCLGEGPQTPTTDPNLDPALSYEVLSGPVMPYTLLMPNGLNGTINVHSGVIGDWVIKATSPGGGCADTDTFTVSIFANSASTVSYPFATYCPTDVTTGDATVSVGNGTFASAPATVVWNNAATGDIDLVGTPAGVYTIVYTPHVDSCATPSYTTIEIETQATPVFDYVAQNYCEGDSMVVPDITFLPPGAFSVTAGTPANLGLNAATGAINMAVSVPDTYVVTYTPTATCSQTASDSVIVMPRPSAQFTLPDSACIGEGSITATIIDPGGVFRHWDNYLVISNPATGVIDVDNSSLGGPFEVIYFMNDPFCPDSTVDYLTILEKDTAEIQYSKYNWCKNEPNAVPLFISGTTGGQFFSDSAGINISNSTGVVNLANTDVGTYNIKYILPNLICPDTLLITASFVVDSFPSAFFDLGVSSLCEQQGLVPMDTLASAAGNSFAMFSGNNPLGGAFSGTSLNTDNIVPGGPYLIRNIVTLGACTDTFVDYITILASDDASFYYDPLTFCADDQDPVPFIQATGGGTFWADTSVNNATSVNPTTGQVDLSVSGDGTHTINYATNGACPDTASSTINVFSVLDADFSYVISQFCISDTANYLPDYIALPNAGTFIGQAGILVDSVTGEINVDSSTAGIFDITYDLDSAGNCQNQFTLTVEIVDIDTSTSIDYLGTVFCKSDADPLPIIIGDSTGTFLATGGLAFSNQDSGIVSLENTSAGTHIVRYQLSGICAEIAEDTIEVLPYDDPTFSYDDNEFCRSDTNPLPVNFATPGIGFFSTRGQTDIVLADTLTGEIDLANSLPGQHLIWYTSGGTCAKDTFVQVAILAGPTNISLIGIPDTNVICAGDEIMFMGGGGAFYSFKVDGNFVSAASSYSTDTLRNGQVVTVVVQAQDGCRDSVSRLMTVNPIPDGIIQNYTNTITTDQQIVIEMTSTAAQTFFDWNVSSKGQVNIADTSGYDGPAGPFSADSITNDVELLSNFNPALITFYITPVAQGCEGEPDTLIIRVNPNDQPIFVPEVFTPNGDGINDSWQIQWTVDIDPNNYVMYLFNRSGGQVMDMSPLNGDWDGESLPDGVYWWKLADRAGNVLDHGGLTIRRK